MNSASAATSVRMCCASIRTASAGPDTSVDVVAANVPPPCSKGKNGPMNTSACRSLLPADGEIVITLPFRVTAVVEAIERLSLFDLDIEGGIPGDGDP